MGFLTTLLGIIGFSMGIPLGLFVGFFLFIYDKPKHVEYPIVTPLHELDVETLRDLLLEVPSWVKYSDYARVDWLNMFVSDMWPYLDKAICDMIQRKTKPIFAKYIGSYQIKSIEFETLTLGVFPPTIYGMKVFETNEKELVLEPVLRWAGNPNITLVLKLLSVPIAVQLVDLQIFATPRITLAPLVPSFPCFSNVAVSLMEKPHIDFGMKVLGGDIMAIPGLYRYVQETIKKQVERLYLWPQTLKIPILDCSVGSTKKPVGVLHVKVIRALKLLKMDIVGSSDPYVKLGLSSERLQSKKTKVKMNCLNPEWNEEFKLIVKDPESEVLQLQVFDWDKVGEHDNLGMQVVPLSMLVPQETKSFTLDLVENLNSNDPQNKRKRGQLIVELTLNIFREDLQRFSGSLLDRKESSTRSVSEDTHSSGAGVLLVVIQGAEDVEGKNHNNPYAIVVFRGRHKKTKMIKRTRDPSWNEEFQFVVDEAPVNDKIHIQIMSKKRGLSCRGKESLGHVDINLVDVVNNGRLNEKYHLINSKNGLIHVEIGWKTT